MALFIVRIELHGTDDYDTLYETMAKESFEKTIVGKKGIEYDLPTGVYCKECGCTLNDAREAAIRASSKYERSILVVEAKGCAWENLHVTKKG